MDPKKDHHDQVAQLTEAFEAMKQEFNTNMEPSSRTLGNLVKLAITEKATHAPNKLPKAEDETSESTKIFPAKTLIEIQKQDADSLLKKEDEKAALQAIKNEISSLSTEPLSPPEIKKSEHTAKLSDTGSQEDDSLKISSEAADQMKKRKRNESSRAWHLKNKEKINAKRREDYREKREKNNIRQREYHQKNKDKIQQRNKEYRQKNKDKIQQKNKEYRQKNKNKIKIRLREWNQKNKDKVQEYQRKNKDKIRRNHQKYYQKNKDQVKQKNQEYKRKNNDKIKIWKQKSYQKNKNKTQQKDQEWYQKNKDKINRRRREYRQKNRNKINLTPQSLSILKTEEIEPTYKLDLINSQETDSLKTADQAKERKKKEDWWLSWRKNKGKIRSHHRAYYPKNQDKLNAKWRQKSKKINIRPQSIDEKPLKIEQLDPGNYDSSNSLTIKTKPFSL